VVEAYHRRRAWAAFHAGYGLHAKDARLDDLLGKPRPGQNNAAPGAPMSAEAMAQNIRRWRIATASKTAPERTPDHE